MSIRSLMGIYMRRRLMNMRVFTQCGIACELLYEEFTNSAKNAHLAQQPAIFHTLIPFRSHACIMRHKEERRHTHVQRQPIFSSLHCTCVYIIKPILFLFTWCTRVCVFECEIRCCSRRVAAGVRRRTAHFKYMLYQLTSETKTHTLFALEFYYIAWAENIYLKKSIAGMGSYMVARAKTEVAADLRSGELKASVANTRQTNPPLHLIYVKYIRSKSCTCA